MLTESRLVKFKNGVAIDTPLLVPSLSSRGFPPIEVERRTVPAPAGFMKILTASAFEPALLISAFDIARDQVLERDQLQTDYAKSPYGGIGLLIVDSGWYEYTTDADSNSPYRQAGRGKWSRAQHEATIKTLPPVKSVALVSYDTHAAYDEQIEQALKFFGSRPHAVSTIMLKPPTKGGYHHLDRLAEHAGRLVGFDIVGVSEKELGKSIIDRMVALAELRKMLTGARVAAPIHVFGALDPLITPLYFSVGAEIFDGLSWLRFAYHGGVAIHRESMLLLGKQVDVPIWRGVASIAGQNLVAIGNLSRDLRLLHSQQDWGVFSSRDVLKYAYDAYESEAHRGR